MIRKLIVAAVAVTALGVAACKPQTAEAPAQPITPVEEPTTTAPVVPGETAEVPVDPTTAVPAETEAQTGAAEAAPEKK